MRSSRLDIVPLLDIIMLLFFALALSMQKEHKKEKHQLMTQLVESQTKFDAEHLRLQKQSVQNNQLRKQFNRLHTSHEQLNQVFLQLQRLMGTIQFAQSGRKTNQKITERLSLIKKKLLKLRDLVEHLRSQKEALLRVQKKLKVTLHRLLIRFQTLSGKEKKLLKALRLLKEQFVTLQANNRLANRAQTRLRNERQLLQARLMTARTSLTLLRERNRRNQTKTKALLAERRKRELAHRVLTKRLREALKERYAKRAKSLNLTVKKQKKRWKELKLRTIVLQAELEMMKRDARQRKQTLKKWRRTAEVLRANQFRYEASMNLVTRRNRRLEKAFRKSELKLQKQNFYRQSERKAFRRTLSRFEKRERHLSRHNEQLKSSQRQMSTALKRLKILGRLPGKEKSGLTKSMNRYLLAVFIYIKSDRITGFRRFKDGSITKLDRPIGLSRRTLRGHRLKYRRSIEPSFSAFARLDARLPAEVVSSLEAIYIFVFDEHCTKAVTSGLEHEHQAKYKARRVIWQL